MSWHERDKRSSRLDRKELPRDRDSSRRSYDYELSHHQSRSSQSFIEKKRTGRSTDKVAEKLATENRDALLKIEKFLKQSGKDVGHQTKPRLDSHAKNLSQTDRHTSSRIKSASTSISRKTKDHLDYNRDEKHKYTDSQMSSRSFQKEENLIDKREINHQRSQRDSFRKAMHKASHHDHVKPSNSKDLEREFRHRYPSNDTQLEPTSPDFNKSSSSVHQNLSYYDSFSQSNSGIFSTTSSSKASLSSVRKELPEESYSWVGEFLDDEEDTTTSSQSKRDAVDNHKSRDSKAISNKRYTEKSSTRFRSHDAEDRNMYDERKRNPVQFKIGANLIDKQRSPSKTLVQKRNDYERGHEKLGKYFPKMDSNNNFRPISKLSSKHSREKMASKRHSQSNSPSGEPKAKHLMEIKHHFEEQNKNPQFLNIYSDSQFRDNEKQRDDYLDNDNRQRRHFDSKQLSKRQGEKDNRSHHSDKVSHGSPDTRHVQLRYTKGTGDSLYEGDYQKEVAQQVSSTMGDSISLQRNDHMEEDLHLSSVNIRDKYNKVPLKQHSNDIVGELSAKNWEMRNFGQSSTPYAEKSKWSYESSYIDDKYDKPQRDKDRLEWDDKIQFEDRRSDNKPRRHFLPAPSALKSQDEFVFHGTDEAMSADDEIYQKYGSKETTYHRKEYPSRGSRSPEVAILRKSGKISVSEFSGAWKAATNSDITVEQDPVLYRHNAAELAFALHTAKKPLRQPDHPLTKQQSVRKVERYANNSTASTDRSDKREVLYSSNRNSISRYDTIESSSPQRERNVYSADKPAKHTSSRSEVNKEFLDRKVSNAEERNPTITLSKHIPVGEMEFWGKDFVDWFSKHILPTRSFKSYMENICPKMTSSDLAAMPMNFLEHLQDGDRYAISCIPKDKFESRKLFSFLGKFRELEDIDKNLSEEKMISSPKKASLDTERCEHEKMKHRPSDPKKIQLESGKDANIPVLISANSMFKNALERNVSTDKMTTVPTGVEDKSVKNLIITCNNLDSAHSNSLSQSPGRTVVNASHTLPSQQHFNDQVADDLFANSARVNPRWNAEVQDFIGRVQSAKSRPSYIEYLEKCGLDVVSDSDSRGSESLQSLSPYRGRSRSFSPRRRSLSRGNRRSHDRKSRSRNRDSYRRRSRSRSFSRSSFRRGKSGNLSSQSAGRNRSNATPSTSRHSTSQRNSVPQKESRVPVHEESKSKKDSTVKAINDKKPPSKEEASKKNTNNGRSFTRKSSDKIRRQPTLLGKHKEEQPISTALTTSKSVSQISPVSARRSPETDVWKIYNAAKKQTISSIDISFHRTEKNISKESLSTWKEFIKKTAVKELNLMYSFEEYDVQKLLAFFNECRHDFLKAHKRSFSSRNHFFWILKGIFLDNAVKNVQDHMPRPSGKVVSSINLMWCHDLKNGNTTMADKVDVKKRVSERGEDWSVTSFKAFQQFQCEVVRNCEKDLWKTVPYINQRKELLSVSEKKVDILFPQFCGDVESITKLWIWKNQFTKYKEGQHVDYSKELAAWTFDDATTRSVYRFLEKRFMFPLFESSDRKCEAVISVVQAKLKIKERSAIVEDICNWWMEGYYKQRYSEFERNKRFASEKKEIKRTIVNDEPQETNVVEEKSPQEDLIVLDEDNEATVESERDNKSSAIPDDSISLENEDVKEYAEDESGCPTILLY